MAYVLIGHFRPAKSELDRTSNIWVMDIITCCAPINDGTDGKFCDKEAEFSIFAHNTGNRYDETYSCLEHVGKVLGSSTDVDPTHWSVHSVVPICPECFHSHTILGCPRCPNSCQYATANSEAE